MFQTLRGRFRVWRFETSPFQQQHRDIERCDRLLAYESGGLRLIVTSELLSVSSSHIPYKNHPSPA